MIGRLLFSRSFHRVFHACGWFDPLPKKRAAKEPLSTGKCSVCVDWFRRNHRLRKFQVEAVAPCRGICHNENSS